VSLIGIDPDKSTHTAVAIDGSGNKIAQRRLAVNAGTFRQLMCQHWSQRRFAVEGASGLGRSVAQQLAAAGEHVADVPSTPSARARMSATGGDRKTDAADALHVAQVALSRPDLRQVCCEDQTTNLRLLTERRDDLVSKRTRLLNRLHVLLRDRSREGLPEPSPPTRPPASSGGCGR
jgi:transposase